MKSNQSYLYFTAFLLTLIGACQSFGQQSVKQSTEISIGKIKIEQTLDLKKDQLIDFTKVSLDKAKIESIKSEIRMGPGSGGGGNSCALMLKQNTLEILEQIKTYPAFQEGNVADILEKNIKAAKFYLGKDLVIDGKDVEAINYPTKKIIVIEQSVCDKISTLSPAGLGVLLHEYLGLAGFDDSKYQISGPFVSNLYQGGKGKKTAGSFTDIQINNLRTKFQKSQSNFKTLDSQCSYFSEVDGLVTRQTFNLTRTSENSVEIKSESLGIISLKAAQRPAGLYVELPKDESKRYTYIVIREYGEGILIAEWNIVGKDLNDMLQLSKSTYPVASTAERYSLATGYSVCVPNN